MTDVSSEAQHIARLITASLDGPLRSEFERLQIEDVEIQERVKTLTRLHAEAALLRASGQDTTLVEQAIASAVQSLKAAGAVGAAMAARNMLLWTLLEAFQVSFTAMLAL